MASRSSSNRSDRQPLSGRTKPTSASRRSVTPTSRAHSFQADEDPGRVRVAVRLRPKNDEDVLSDDDFSDCVELQPELKRLKLRKNNWSSESYRFDEVFTETASQKRVYEVVAKPVVESVLNGYNGTIMAYGQTGTGKTYTLGKLGKGDAAGRGIMLRALEDIIGNISTSSDTIEVSYFQLYKESIQDLLAPEKTNIPINEDPKTGEVSLPGATVVKIQDLDNFLQLLQVGEGNRHAANTKMNTESSRSHAILMVHIRRAVNEKVNFGINSQEKGSISDLFDGKDIPIVRKSKLLIVDLAGSERIDKSGSEGVLLEEAKFINLSLSSLGKCINALAENSPHIPTRDSKLTRLLRDSFGGTARTSLIITIGPSARHHAETASTIMFGQRAMRIVNTVKVKEEFDYESLCRKLENQVDNLTADIERQQKLRDDDKYELEKQLRECRENFAEANKILVTRSEQQQLEKATYQKVLADTTQMYEKKISELIKQIEDERAQSESVEEQLDLMKKLLSENQKSIQNHHMENSRHQKALAGTTQIYEKKIAELVKQLQDEHAHFEVAEEQLDLAKRLLSDHQKTIQGQKESDELELKFQEMYQLQENTLHELQLLKSENKDLLEEKATLNEKLDSVSQRLSEEEKQRKAIENELVKLKRAVPENDNDFEDKTSYAKEDINKQSSEFGNRSGSYRSNQLRGTLSRQRATIAKICEEVGLQKILQLLASEDSDVQIHGVKVVANLAAEDINQKRIVDEGGLDALLMLLRSSENTTILRVASGAIANLAMNEQNQGLIIDKGGAQLLAKTASKTDDPQTLRMVAGALANLCGNEKLLLLLKEDGGVKALLGMVRSGSSDVIAQVARGLANFAKCESRGIIQAGHRTGRSLLMDDGALAWLIANSNTASASTRRHIELALCHLAQNEDNSKDFISSGGVKVLFGISEESSREDIRNLAKKSLRLNSSLQAEMHMQW
ncbi:kinesin-like protein KIN-UC isoform X4 [Juglans microcarpa x Juglans regia]|uniref:kinesin-like protein KIN-UC isoform X4 n=1 Tax=Juglans microcarpa x Juglans regia TaxID=2249226 RepID=UPI001B7F2514|nr:kinesin-like protein KIN-UC isoform X4 [Juglans microcarpa x Juglans regia]